MHLASAASEIALHRDGWQQRTRRPSHCRNVPQEDFVRAFQASTIHRPMPAAFFERIVAQSLKLPARVWKAALSGLLAANPAPDLTRIRCLVLILGGDRDGVFSGEEQEHPATCIPVTILKIRPRIGHDPQLGSAG
jgi:non-heme chloroperoxidase